MSIITILILTALTILTLAIGILIGYLIAFRVSQNFINYLQHNLFLAREELIELQNRNRIGENK